MRRADSAAWLRDKAAGSETENLVSRLLQHRGAEVLRYEGNARADLEARFIVECKRDRLAPTTGMVAIEVAYNGNPSGIATSTAHAWFIHIGTELFWVQTDQLRALLVSRAFEIKPAGDGGRSRIKLVPIETIRAIARLVVDEASIP